MMAQSFATATTEEQPPVPTLDPMDMMFASKGIGIDDIVIGPKHKNKATKRCLNWIDVFNQQQSASTIRETVESTLQDYLAANPASRVWYFKGSGNPVDCTQNLDFVVQKLYQVSAKRQQKTGLPATGQASAAQQYAAVVTPMMLLDTQLDDLLDDGRRQCVH